MSNGAHSGTIVVLDSEPAVRSIMSKILEQAGYSVRATADFKEAIEIVRGSAPDLVLTNVFLKGITGHDAMRELRKEFPKLPVLMVSGLPDDPAIQRWIHEDGFDAFPKPFTADALTAKVREVIGQQSS